MEYSKDKFQQTQNYSQETLTKPRMRGLELRDEEKVWNGVAASECRIGLMEMMIKQKIAFADLEEFGQEFKNKVKSTKLRNKLSTRSNLGKVTQPAMRIKLAD